MLQAFEVGVAGLDYIFETQVVSLAIAIAKAVIRNEITTTPAQVEHVAKEALTMLPKNASGIKLHMHTDDIALLKETLDPELMDALKNINFVPTSSISRGGCIVEADESYINAGLDTRLDAVIAAINREEYVAANTQ